MSSTIVVVPCYNEAARLPREAFRAFLESGADIRICFVDDGSTDDTRAVLTEFAASCEGADVLGLDRNGGKAEAVRRGILHVLDRQPDYIGYWDADLATPLEFIPEFRHILEVNSDLRMVMGSRVALLGHHVERHAVRHYFGRLIATAAAKTLDLTVYDTQCGAKLLRVDDRTRDLFAQPFIASWMFDVDLIARLIDQEGGTEHMSARINEIPLRAWRDVHGSKVGMWDGVRAFRELVRIYRHHRRPRV